VLLTVFRSTKLLVARTAELAIEERRSVGRGFLVYQFLSPQTIVPASSVIRVRGECSKLLKCFYSVEQVTLSIEKKCREELVTHPRLVL
jgi:hypothetical protein